MNKGSPFNISSITQPADQISTWVEYLVEPNISYGAL